MFDPGMQPGHCAPGGGVQSLRPGSPGCISRLVALLGAAGCSFPSRVESRDRFCGGQKLSGQVAVSGISRSRVARCYRPRWRARCGTEETFFRAWSRGRDKPWAGSVDGRTASRGPRNPDLRFQRSPAETDVRGLRSIGR